MKKILSIALSILSFLMIMPMNVLTTKAANDVWDGVTLTEVTQVGDVYSISNGAELAWVASQVNIGTNNFSGKTINLTADIVLNENAQNYAIWGSFRPSNTWTAIGNDTYQFSGTFDGQGHTVSGVYINIIASSQGFFGRSSGIIKNVGVVNSYIRGNTAVGGVVGLNNGGTVTNCYNTGILNATSYRVGGVVGYNFSSAITTNCYNTGAVTGISNYVGGVVGSNKQGTILNCYNTGTVSGVSYVGGVVGTNDAGTITNSYYYGCDAGIGGTGASQDGTTKFNATIDKSSVEVSETATLTFTNPTWSTANPFGAGFAIEFQSDVASISGTTVTGTTAGTTGVKMVIKQPELISTGFNGATKTIPVGLTVPLTVISKSTACDITSFTLGGVLGTISGTDISVTLPNGTNATSLIPTIEKSAYSTIDKTGAQDFTSPVTYKVTAEDGTTFKDYTVTVTVQKSTACDITSFTLGGVVGTISGTNIAVTLPNGTDLTSLIPTIEKSAYSTIDKTGAQDFTSPVTYKVTAEDGTTFKEYTVTVTVAAANVTTPDPTPTYTIDTHYKEATTENIANIIKDIKDGDIFTIKTTDENKSISGDILEKIKGKDVDVTIDLGNGIEWSFNGKDIPLNWEPKNLNFGVDTKNSNIPVEIINSATGEKRTILANLSYSGEFGFQMTLTIHIGYSDEGKMANLFYYNPQTKKMEFMESSKINSAGNAKFIFTHASDYAIIISDEAITALNTTETAKETNTSNPITGENNPIRFISMIAILSATSLTVVSKKRKFKLVKKG